MPRHLVRPVLRSRENQGPCECYALQQAQQQHRLLGPLHVMDPVTYRRDGRRDPCHLHRNRIAKNLVCQSPDSTRHGRGEEQRLALPREVAQNPPHVGKEAHVEHAVRFIQYENFNVCQTDQPLSHKVQQASGRRNQDVAAGPDGPDLRLLIHAAENDHLPQAGVAGVVAKAVVNLLRQLTSGTEHEGADSVPRFSPAPGGLTQPLQNGQGKRGRLACARLGAAQHVPAVEHVGYGSGLDGRGFRVARRAHGPQERLRKPQVFKSHSEYLSRTPGEDVSDARRVCQSHRNLAMLQWLSVHGNRCIISADPCPVKLQKGK